MTALCGGGGSGPKPGVAELIIFSAQTISERLAAKGGLWGTLASGLLGVLSYDAISLCGSDPPAKPTITSAEYNALLQLQPFDLLSSALGKLRDLVTIGVWYEMCQCSGTATPALPVDIYSPPAGVTIAPSTSVNCPDARNRLVYKLKATTTPWSQANNVTSQVFPGLPLYTSVASASILAQDIVKVDPAWAQFALSVDWVSGAAVGSAAYSYDVFAFDSTKTPIGQVLGAAAWGASPHTRSPASGYTSLAGTWTYLGVQATHAEATTESGVLDSELAFVCSGAGAPVPCCPPPPGPTASLAQVLDLLQAVQRYSVPFAYVLGAVHSSLSGEGSFPITRLCGLKVTVTAHTLPDRVALGTPPYIFDLGWISVQDADGLIQEFRVTRVQQTFFPRIIELATVFGYALTAGTTIDVQELEPEA